MTPPNKTHYQCRIKNQTGSILDFTSRILPIANTQGATNIEIYDTPNPENKQYPYATIHTARTHHLTTNGASKYLVIRKVTQ